MSIVTDEPVNRGGRPRKSVEQHRQDGTFRRARHDPKITEPLDHPKPQHLPPELRTVPDEWIRNESDRRAKANGCWFDIRFAEHYRTFCTRYLRLWEGEWHGKPFDPLPWLWKEVTAPLFGWFRMDPERGIPVRRFTRVYVEVPKKSGKSPSAASIGSYLWAGDEEGGAGIFSTATKRDQANIVHRHAFNMIKASPDIMARCQPNMSTHALKYLPADSIYRSISADAGGSEGLNGSCIVDELHAWHGRDFFESLRYMGASRANPVFFMITTAGDDMDSVCREMHDHGVAVNAGTVQDESFLCFIAAADKNDDPGSPETWRKANPSLGITVFERELRESYEAAKASPAALASFKRYRLNIWGTTEESWLPLDKWEAAGSDYLEKDLHGCEAIGGLDLSRTTDMTALVLAVPDPSEPELIRLLPKLWIPEEVANNRKKLAPYHEWEAAGFLTIIPGPVIRFDVIEEEMTRLAKLFTIRKLRFDRKFTGDWVTNWCERERIEAVDFQQTATQYTAPLGEFERRMFIGGIRHPKNPVLSWQAAHTLVDKKPYGWMLKKRRPGDYRTIDGIVAAVMGASGWFGEEVGASPYTADRGPIVL